MPEQKLPKGSKNQRSPKSLKQAVLRDSVKKREKKSILDLAGEIEFREDFDHKKLRELRNDFG